MEITKIKVADIKPYFNNAKLHPQSQIEQIKRSITEFGNNDPIAVDENNVIIEGHGRLLALQELGYDEVECIVLKGLTDDQKNAYRLIHNQLTMNSGWDLEKLEEELKNIDIDMGDFDFETQDIVEQENEVQEDDFDCTPPAEAKAKLGDIYQLGNHRLMCGDSTSEKDVETLMGGGLL